MRAITLFFIFSIVALLGISFSYAQFGETMHIGNPAAGAGNTVSTGELDAGIWAWLGKGITPAITVTPTAKIYDPPEKTVEFEVDNAYPSARTISMLWVRNTGTIPVKVEDKTWNLPDNVSIVYECGGDIPEDVADEAIEIIQQSDLPDDIKEEMVEHINEHMHGLHEGLVLDKGESDVFIFKWHFNEDTIENSSFTGSCTINFTQFNTPG